jgi:hypothetical protein
MIKSLPKPSKLYASDPCTVIWSENDQRQSQNFMKTLPNSANQVSFTFTSLNSKEKHSSMTKPQDQHVTTTTTSATTPSISTTSIPMSAGLWKIRKRILGHPTKKESKDFQQQSKPVQSKRRHVKWRMRSWLIRRRLDFTARFSP